MITFWYVYSCDTNISKSAPSLQDFIQVHKGLSFVHLIQLISVVNDLQNNSILRYRKEEKLYIRNRKTDWRRKFKNYKCKRIHLSVSSYAWWCISDWFQRRAAVADLENLKKSRTRFPFNMCQIGPAPNSRQGEEVVSAVIYAVSVIWKEVVLGF